MQKFYSTRGRDTGYCLAENFVKLLYQLGLLCGSYVRAGYVPHGIPMGKVDLTGQNQR